MSEVLLFGEVGVSGSPFGQGAEIWYLAADSFGNQNTGGDDFPLRLETANYLPAGRGGEVNLRKIYVPIAYEGACTIRVTPIVNFSNALRPTTVSFALPTKRTRKVIEANVDEGVVTQVRLKIEVVSTTGRVEFFTPDFATDPITEAGHVIAGAD